MTLSEVQKKVDEWIKSYGIRYFNELTNMAILTEEVGELARVISRVYGEQSFKSKPEVTPNEMLADEMADVLFVLTCMANQMDIDLEKALKKNLEKKTSRDSERHKSNPNLQ